MAKPDQRDGEGVDFALMRRMALGDETALSKIYDRYSGHVYSVALRILQDPALAEEILQDVFYKLWLDVADFDPQRGSLAGWLVVIARNRAISRLRKRKLLNTGEIPDMQVPAPETLASTMENRLMLDQIRSALDELPRPQRQALDLAYFEGLTHSEIAERTGEPLGTIKSRLRSALNSLRKAVTQ